MPPRFNPIMEVIARSKACVKKREHVGKDRGEWWHGIGSIARAPTFNLCMKEANNHLMKDVNNKAMTRPNLVTN
jgi:hypothetical protein